MLVARSVVLNKFSKSEETVSNMGKDGVKIEDVEEGEISDSASVEEITEEDFHKQEVGVSKESTKPKGDTRVWTMQDLFSNPMSRGYATGLYNFAWAQAVQNKPLKEIYLMDVDSDENSKISSTSTVKDESKVINVDSGDEIDVKMEESEKEEGELEEGEIDLDSDPVENGISNGNLNAVDSKIDSENGELEKQVKYIVEVLESVSVVKARKSFNGVCSQLQNTLGSLQVVLKNICPTKDALIQLAFSAIQVLYSVFCSLNSDQKEQNKEIFSRLISVVMKHDPPLFSPEKMKEIESMMPMLSHAVVLLNAEIDDTEKEKSVSDLMDQHDPATSANNLGHNLNPLDKFGLDNESSTSKNVSNMSKASNSGLFSLKVRGALAPLLDLHKDHDVDSLPSPTRGTPPRLPVLELLAVGDGMPKLESIAVPRPDAVMSMVARKADGSVMHPYETEALKAVSSYQRKFGRSSFLSNDRLPSPTPSEESDNGDSDIGGEVSSSTIANAKNSSSSNLVRPIVSPAIHTISASVEGQISATNDGPVSSVSTLSLKTSAKSRDPRLRFAGSNVGALELNQRPLPGVSNGPKVEPFGGIARSRKNSEEPILDGHVHKRPRNGSMNSDVVRDVSTVSVSGGWLEDTGTVGSSFMNKNHVTKGLGSDPRKMDAGVTSTTAISVMPSIATNGIEQVLVSGSSTASTTPALPTILKDIAVNPSMLLNLLKMGQGQKLAADVQQKHVDPATSTAHPPSSNSILGAVPVAIVTPLKPSVVGQKPAGMHVVPSPLSPMDDLGKIRMKPRDPRRVLHSTASKNGGNLGSEQFKTNGAPTSSSMENKDHVNAQKPEDKATSSMTSQPVPPPDIARQFTNNLKNIADLVQTTIAPSVTSQTFPPLSVHATSEKLDVKATNSDSNERQTGPGSVPGVSTAGPSKPQNMWGDVEHFLEGFDDQQKAAIHRERARRLEEQNKMFAARKLCLVLDLDHTLLNSAKFAEVEPVHDEILRKKEEQDREKPQRHLFRFAHMGMWTKLRPGIWNFLEKASKLYELHLYTMGNKLYATEMAKVLDPKGNLFAGRVISRGDDGDPFDGDERVPKSKDLEGVLGMESAVVIIDDSIRVWPHNKLNLIVVERYTYFPCSRRQFGLLGPSLLEIDHDERPEDGTLASCSAVIERIHQNFFSNRSLDDVDVRNILASEQQKILAGCRIVFSRVFPVGEANPHLHPLWQTAEQFGAVCTNQIDEQVTHVVANSLGTDKVNWALSTGRFVVSPGWVEASALLYRRANEQDFAIKS